MGCKYIRLILCKGYYKNISDLSETKLKDGSKSLEVLENNCPDYLADPNKYPAWKAVESYGTKTLRGGWYIPSVSEMEEIDANKTKLDASLEKLNGSAKKIGTSYWTCNQDSMDKNALKYSFSAHKTDAMAKKEKAWVRPVRAFTSKSVDYTKAEPGDIVFENGMIAAFEDYCSNAKVAAIIFRAKTDDGPAMGVGVNQGSNLAWCTADAAGYAKIDVLTDEYITISSEAYEEFYYAVPEVITNPEKYPAWQYCITYGITNKLDQMLLGWTLPSVEEITALYTNQTKVNQAIAKINTNSGSSLSEYTSDFWSCNQSKTGENQAQICNESSSLSGDKKNSYKVIAVREFTNTVKPKVKTPVVTGLHAKDSETSGIEEIQECKEQDGSIYIKWGGSKGGKVYITCETKSADIYYYDITNMKLYKYTKPFDNLDTTYKVFAISEGYSPSDVKTVRFQTPVY